MNQQQAKQFLQALSGKHIAVHGGWARASCPLAPWTHQSGKDASPSFAIRYFQTPGKRSYYNCFSCSNGGKLENLAALMLHYSKGNGYDLALAYKLIEEEESEWGDIPEWQLNKPKTEEFEPWPSWWLDSFPPASGYIEAIAYLQSRGISYDEIEKWSIKWDSSRKAVGFPFWRHTGELAGMRGRLLEPYTNADGKLIKWHDYGWKEMRNTKTTYFNEHNWDFGKPLVLVEGAIKCIAVSRVYSNVISPLSVGFSEEKCRRLLPSLEVVCFFDNDKGGQIGFERVKKILGKKSLVQKVPYPEQYADKDPDEIPTSDLALMLQYVGLKTL